MAQVVDCGFHPPPGAPYPLPQLPLTPGWSRLCLFPSHHPFYDGEGWFSPNPADTSSLCPSLTLLPWEAPRWPPKLSQQDGAPATHSSSQMGPKRGSGSPTVTQHAVSSGPRVSSSSCPTTALGGWGRNRPFFSHFSRENWGSRRGPRSPETLHEWGSWD